MLSKSKIKIVKSLKYKKNRINSKLFLVEGIKGIREVLNSDYNTLFTILSQNAYDDLDKNLLMITSSFILKRILKTLVA